MSWARLDDGLIDHPKFNELMMEPDGWAAFGFWSAMLIWANKHTRNKAGREPGLLKRADVHAMDRANAGKFAGLLVKVGLWELRGEDWQIHDFHEYLPSERKLAAQKANAAKGGQAKAANRLASGQAKLATGQETLATGLPNSSHAPGTGKGSSLTTGSPIAEGGAGGVKNATRIPDPFKVTPEMVAWARKTVPHVDGKTETEKFIDYWIAASGANARKKDWAAAWRTWMRNADERLGRITGRAPGQQALPPGDPRDEWMHRR